MRILLLGGTGVIGTALAKELSLIGHDVFTTTRRSNPVRAKENLWEEIEADAKNPESLKSILATQEFNVIVDFIVCKTDIFKKRLELILPSSAHYFYLSSYRVFADSGINCYVETSKRLTETLLPKTFSNSNEYAIEKCRQEDILTSCKYDCWTIVRPSIIYGKNRLQLANLEAEMFLPRLDAQKTVVLPRSILGKFACMTSAIDFARIFSKLISSNSLERQIFNIGTNEEMRWDDIVNVYKLEKKGSFKFVSNEKYEDLGLNIYQLYYDRVINRKCNPAKVLAFIKEDDFQFEALHSGLSNAIKQTNVKTNRLTRLSGAMDYILDKQDFKAAYLNKSLLRYSMGYFSILNRFVCKMYKKKYLGQTN